MSERAADYRLNDTIFRVEYGDITKLNVDVVVSSDDNYLSMGGGVSQAIWLVGGDAIRDEAKKHLPLKVGDVAVTTAGALPSKYVFHVVTIDYDNLLYADEDSIRKGTLECLRLANRLGARSIAFPALATGVAKFPFRLAAETITNTIAEYLMGDTQLQLVVITLFAREGITQEQLNIFYERSVALASISTQAKKFDALLNDLDVYVSQLGLTESSKYVAALRSELQQAQTSLDSTVISVEQPGGIEATRELEAVGKKIAVVDDDPTVLLEEVGEVNIPNETEEYRADELQRKLLRTKLQGLYTIANIQAKNLNEYQIERAKYGTEGVPVRLEHSIIDIELEIENTENQIKQIRMQLVSIGG